MERTRFLIVGAGVTGLSFADRIASDDYLIFEAESEIGGYCRTVHQDGFVWDYSGHFFHFRHPELEEELVRRMGDQKVLVVNRDSRIYWEGKWIDFPFQKNIHQLPQETFIDCLYDLQFKPSGEPENFKDMLYKKFGRSIAELFLIPYNEKLYATELEGLDVHAMGRFFPYADMEGIIRNFRRPDNSSYNATFTYPEGGAIQYVEALAEGVRRDRIRLNCRVQSIDLRNRVAHTEAGPVQYEHLISSTPFNRLLSMAGLPHDPTLFTWNKVLVFNLGFDRKGPESIHWAYFPQREYVFYRVGFYDNIFNTERMSTYVEVGFPKDANIDANVIETTRHRVVQDMQSAGLITEHQLVAHHSVVLDPAYVHITKASNESVLALKRVLRLDGIHSLGRYGSWTYCSIEDNMLEARSLADAFNLSAQSAASP